MADSLVEHRLTNLERAFAETTRALQGINESLHTLAVASAQHTETRKDLTRAFAELHAVESRLREVERALPTMQLVTRYAIAGVVSCVGLVGAALMKQVL